MDKDRIKGTASDAKGNVKEKAGEALGDEKMRGEGKADKAEGKVQKGVGEAKDKLRDALR